MKRKMSVWLFAGMFGFSLCAGTILQPEWNREEELKTWGWNAEKTARILPGGILEIHLGQPVANHVHGISHAIDSAKVAGKRIPELSTGKKRSNPLTFRRILFPHHSSSVFRAQPEPSSTAT